MKGKLTVVAVVLLAASAASAKTTRKSPSPEMHTTESMSIEAGRSLVRGPLSASAVLDTTYFGDWDFASGVDYADWNNLQIFLPQEGKPPEHYFALVPKSDYDIVDDWYVTGLAAMFARGESPFSLRDVRAHLPNWGHCGHPEVRIHYDGKRVIDDPTSLWFEFTGEIQKTPTPAACR